MGVNCETVCILTAACWVKNRLLGTDQSVSKNKCAGGVVFGFFYVSPKEHCLLILLLSLLLPRDLPGVNWFQGNRQTSRCSIAAGLTVLCHGKRGYTAAGLLL